MIKKSKLRFIIGCILLVVNQPIGWGGMVFFNSIALKYHKTIYSYLGFGIYGLSWAMLGLGGFLAGQQGIRWSKSIFKNLFSSIIQIISRKRKQ
jgi:hypothetical protein